MEAKPWIARLVPAVVLAAVASLLFVRISAFGIWDPWELASADAARSLLAGEAGQVHSDVTTWVVALGFKLFGVHEWSGRAPVALCGLLTVIIAYGFARRFVDRTTGVYAAIVAGTTPLFLFNARQMLGHAPAFALHGLLGLCALVAFLPQAPSQDATPTRRARHALWWVATAGLAILATWHEGAVVGIVPPLLAATITAFVAADHTGTARARALRYAKILLPVPLLLVALRLAMGGNPMWNMWLGGVPKDDTPPAFQTSLEQVFHAFAPWSALIPAAAGAILWPAPKADAPTNTSPERAAGVHVLLWMALGYAATTAHEAFGGDGVFLPIVPCAVAVAILLRQVTQSNHGWWTAGLVSALLVALQLRDFRLYPGSPTEGMDVTEMTIPDVFSPGIPWAITLGLFAVATFVSLSIGPSDKPLSPRAPYQFLRDVWRMDWANKVWLALAALVGVALLLGSVGLMIFGAKLGWPSVAVKWGIRVGLLPLAVPVVVLLGQVGLFLASRLGPYRLAPLFIAAFVTAGYAAQGYLPELSTHFSPRGVYDRYNALAKAGEPLAEYRIGSRAAAYYAKGSVTELRTQAELVSFLAKDGRRWAVCPSDELSAIDRAFRHETGRHIFVADAKSARVLLVANQPVAGRTNENYVAEAVISEPPKMDHTVGIRFEDRIELLGYDIQLPHKDYVGAGETVTVTWYWKALKSHLGTWKIFVHVDGEGLRLNGDHDPVNGRYAVNMWDEGDIVVDKQDLKIPANYRSGDYSLLVGFYSGETRLKIVSGPSDGDNRGKAGILPIR